MPGFGCLRAEGENHPSRPGHLVCFAQNQRDEVRDLGEHSGALAANAGMKQQSYLAYALQGNGIDRADTAGCNGCGWKANVSCCRLRNELQDNTFSYTLGAGGVSTGSKCVISININRLVQDAVWDAPLRDIMDRMEIQIEKIHKYLIAFNEILKERLAAGLLPVYDAGYIALDKQYLTIGVNGLVEGAEALNIPVEADNPEYIAYVDAVLSPIYAANRAARTSELMFNTEMVPAEGLGVKNAAWDKASKLYVPRDCYNSYFFIVEDPTVNILDRLRFHGKAFTRYLDGGSACHINLDEHLTKEQYLLLLNAAIRTGCNYLTFNVPNTLCNSCGYISKHQLDTCPKCGSRDLDYATRIIGYLKLISRFAHDRQIEASKRHYSHGLEGHHEGEAES